MNREDTLQQLISRSLLFILLIWMTVTSSAQTGALKILTQPQNVAVPLGSDATFTVTAEGTPPFTYQWAFMGSNLLGATTASLTVMNVQLSQCGPYSVVLSNPIGSLASSPAMLSAEGVVAWGLSPFGVLDIPPGLTNVVAISSGSWHNLALKADGTVVAWGGDDSGQLNIPVGLGNVKAIAAGDFFNLALKTDGTITGWGQTVHGELDFPQDLTNVVAIAAGGGHALALRANGAVVGWGRQPGVPAGLTNIVAIAAGNDFDMALRADGTVVSWGSYVWTSNDGFILAYSPAGLTNVIAIAAGAMHSMALRADGSIVAWGANWYGETDIPPGLNNVVAIAAGDRHSIALRSDGTVFGWGLIGDVPEPANLNNSVAIAAGGEAYLALLGDVGLKVAVQPWDRTVFSGSSATFAVKALGMQPVSYQWQFNGSRIAGATADTYSIAGVQPTNAGAYSVMISNNIGTAISRQANLVVLSLAGTNQPLFIDEPGSWTLNPTVSFSHQIVATDPNAPSADLLFTWAAPAPIGALLSPSGVFSWTPTEDQAASTNVIAIWVSDAFTSASKLIEVVVNQTNTPPVLPPQSDRIIFGPTQLVVTNTAIDFDIPTNVLSYQLATAPPGATIDTYGIVRWTPDVALDPSTNAFATVVTDNGIPPLTATNSFTVVALISNQPPVLEIPDTLILTQKTMFSLQVSASDLDSPPTSLVFTLEPGAPLGASLTTNGVFSWTPTETQAPSTNPVTICVSDGTTTVCKTVQMIVNEIALEILSSPHGGSFGIGSDENLSVQAHGIAPIFYQWNLNGTNLPGQTEASLMLTNAQPDESGFYSVIVSNESGTISTAPVLVSIVGIVTWGIGPPDSRAIVPSGLTNVVALAAGAFFDLALNADGTVVAWGDNTFGQLDVPPGLTNVIAIAAGGEHSLALRADGTVVGWGTQWPTYVPVPPGLTNAVAIDVGEENNLALKSDGTVVAWGWDSEDLQFPAVSPVGLSNVVAISAGWGLGLALKADGTVVDWDDAGGHLSEIPDLTNVVALSSGWAGILALKADGTIEGRSTEFLDPNRLLEIPPGLTNVVAISGKGDHGLALIDDGTVVAWGTNAQSYVPPGLPNVVSISGGTDHSLALLRDGSPSMTVQPWDRSVPMGGAASLQAKVVGLQALNYKWRLNGSDIPGATSDTYNISKVESSNAGIYSLAASNPIGSIASRLARLIVVPGASAPPGLVLVAPGNFAVNVGQAVTFTNSAADSNSANQLIFSLDIAPPGAAITSGGVFTWRPAVGAAATTNQIEVRVTDDSTPPLSDTKSFTISVNALQPVSLTPSIQSNSQLRLRMGGTVGPDYILQTSGDLTNWVNLQTNSPALMPFDFFDNKADFSTHRFYRLRLGP